MLHTVAAQVVQHIAVLHIAVLLPQLAAVAVPLVQVLALEQADMTRFFVPKTGTALL